MDPERAKAYREVIPEEFGNTTSEMFAAFVAMLPRYLDMLGGSFEDLASFEKAARADMVLGLMHSFSGQSLQFVLMAHMDHLALDTKSAPTRGGGARQTPQHGKPCDFFNKEKGCSMGKRCHGAHVCAKCKKPGHPAYECRGGKPRK